MNQRLLVLTAVLSLPCLAGAAAEAPPSKVVPSVRAPLTVKWLARSASAGHLELTLRVTFNSPIKDPVTVSVSVPPSFKLLKGRATFLVVAPPELGAVDTDYGLDFPAGAAGDLVVEVDLQGPGFGLHAKDVYTVGAPSLAPKAATVEATAPPVRVNGVDLGPPTPLGR